MLEIQIANRRSRFLFGQFICPHPTTSVFVMARSNWSSSELALNAIQIFIGLNVLAHMFRDDLDYRLNLSKRHRIFDGYVIPLFYHVDPGHLAINMLALHQYGNEIFVRSTSKRWRSHYMVVFSYLGKP